MAAELHAVGERHIVADMAIVADMRGGHEVAAVADDGDAAAFLASRVHRHGFADHRIGPDTRRGIGIMVIADLAFVAQNGVWHERSCARPVRRAAMHHDMRMKLYAIAQHDIAVLQCSRGQSRHPRPDARRLQLLLSDEFSLFACGPSAIMALYSASAQSVSPT